MRANKISLFFLYKSLQHRQCTSVATLFFLKDLTRHKIKCVLFSNVQTSMWWQYGRPEVDVTSPFVGARCC